MLIVMRSILNNNIFNSLKYHFKGIVIIIYSLSRLVCSDITDYSLIIINNQSYLRVNTRSEVKPEMQMYPRSRVPVFINKDSHAIKAGENTLFLLLPLFLFSFHLFFCKSAGNYTRVSTALWAGFVKYGACDAERWAELALCLRLFVIDGLC